MAIFRKCTSNLGSVIVGKLILDRILWINGEPFCLIGGKLVSMAVRGGVAMFDPEFTKFRFYDDDAGEAASAPLENQDVDHTLNADSDVSIQVRMFAQNRQAAGSTDDYRIDYDKNGAALFAVVPTSDTGDGIQTATAGLTNTNATTNRTTNGIADGTGSFDAGEQITDGLGNITLNASNYTEHAFGVQFISANVANNDTFDFEFGRPNAMVNTIVPRITISKAAGGLSIPLAFDNLSRGNQ